MYLKSLVVQGFKSFPDKTVINFTSGITAIVGPNGSGKSNIVDAIRWVLGEQSSKTLRGTKMEDVIFNGTSARGPAGFAEVTLVMDNADHALPVEFDEVAVTRRLYRSGESEYSLNGKTSRLKDIVELFMNTGVGRDGYSVIGQGKISDVLSAKSEDRRQIFEEAAGISKYRYRKVEVERKLASTTDNLSRVYDIISELEERVGPLKEQSEKAKTYLSLRDEKKQLEINVWLDSIDKTNETKAAVNEKLEIAKGELFKVTSLFDNEQERMDKLSALSQGKYIEIDELSRAIRQAEEDSSSLVSRKAVTQNDIDHANETINKIGSQVEEGKTRFDVFDNEVAQRRTQQENIKKEISLIDLELEEILRESAKQIEAQSGLTSSIENLRAKMTVKTGELTDAKIRLAAIEGQFISVDSKISAIDDEIQKKGEELSVHKTELKKATDEYDDVIDKINSNENIIEGYKRKLEVKLNQETAYEAKIKNFDSQIVEKTHKKNLLSAMEEQFDGFANSVKFVMQEAKRGRLKNVYGTISSLLSVDDKFAVAIETALGGAIQNIVVEGEADAKAAIMLLKSENKGRATFLPISSVKGTAIETKDLDKEFGYVGIASDLLKFDKKYSSIFLNLLGRTVVVETIDNAIAISKKNNYRFRIVTLDGQLVNAGGSFTGGSQVKGSGVLSRKNEIAQLTEELIKLNQQADEVKGMLHNIKTETAAIRAGLEGANAEQNVAREQLIRVEGMINQYKALISALNLAIDDLTDERQQIINDNLRAKKLQAELHENINAVSHELKNLEDEFEQISNSHNEATAIREKLTNDISDKKMEIVSLGKNIEALEFEINQIEMQRQSFAEELKNKGDEILAIQAEIEKYKGILHQIDEDNKHYLEIIKDSKEKIKSAELARNEAEKSINEIRKNSKDIFNQKETLIKEVARFESKKAAVDAEYDNIITKLWDEYELTLTESYAYRTPLDNSTAANRRINEIKNKMKALGNVNIDAIEEYKQVKERYDFLKVQVDDLERSKSELTSMIENLTNEMKKIFTEQFKVINENFSKVFVELFGGGSAKLELTEPSDVLESGIEIFVTPPGKIIKHLTALSGGEQAFTAVSLYFAIMAVRPAPFCILDEIDAPLDDVNVARLANYLKKLSETSQFISITHKRGTMERADILYGVTMQESGVTKLLTINVNDIEKKFKNLVN